MSLKTHLEFENCVGSWNVWKFWESRNVIWGRNMCEQSSIYVLCGSFMPWDYGHLKNGI